VAVVICIFTGGGLARRLANYRSSHEFLARSLALYPLRTSHFTIAPTIVTDPDREFGIRILT